MTEEAAELNYTEAESLIPGRIVEDAPEDWVGGDVELQLLDVSKDTLSTSESEEDEGDDPENNERELDFIIQKIKESMLPRRRYKTQMVHSVKLSGETLLFCAGPWLVGVLVL